jgi:AraC family transcriptional regulator
MPVSAEETRHIGVSPSSLHSSHLSIVEISPPDIAHRRLANWGAIQADAVKVTRRGTFEYGLRLGDIC